jgi:hypothetical protein
LEKQPFIETKFYKVYISPLISLLFAVFGNTVGIWALYIFVKIFFVKIWPSSIWPGIRTFIQDGSILLISFSFLASAFYFSTRRLKITFYNVAAGLLLLSNTIFYWRAIALKNSNNSSWMSDDLIHDISVIAFFIAIVLLYLIQARDKYMENTDALEERESEYDHLRENFNPNQNG